MNCELRGKSLELRSLRRIVCVFLVLSSCLLFPSTALAQSKEQLEKERAQVEKEIKNLNNEFELFMIKYEGDIKLDERMKELYDEGKVSEDDYLEAETARSISDTDLIIYNIRSHILYNEIQMLQK